MAEAPIMPLYTDAIVGDTMHLSAEEFGAYTLLLIATWRNNGKALPNHDVLLARICRVSLSRFQAKLKPQLIGFFDISDGYLHQKRLEAEYQKLENRRKICAEKGKLGAEVKKAKSLKNNEAGEATASRQLKPRESYPYPYPYKKEEANASSKEKRATRLPSDFEMPGGWIEDGRRKREGHNLPPIDLLLESEKFRNYWIAKNGSGAAKTDWHRTWINWCLSARQSVNGGGICNGQHKQSPGTTLVEGFARASAAYREPIGTFVEPLLDIGRSGGDEASPSRGLVGRPH